MQGKKSKFEAKLLMLLLTFFLFACAEELPEEVSEDIQTTVGNIGEFDQTLKITTQADSSLALEKESDAIKNVFAVNSTQLRNIQVLEGSGELAKYLKNLKLPAVKPGDVYTVSFKLTDKTMVAYIKKDDQNSTLSGSLQMLETAQDGATPLFQFPIQAWGILEYQKDAQGEETNTIIFKERDRGNSTHVKISPLVTNRKLSGLRGMSDTQVQTLFAKNKLENKIWNLSDALKIFTTKSLVEDLIESVKETFSSHPAIIKIQDNKAYVLTPQHIDDIENIEQQVLGIDPRMQYCSKEMASIAQMDEALCVLTPLYAFDLRHVALSQEVEQGQILAISQLIDGDVFSANIVEIKRDQEAKAYFYREELATQFDTILLSRDELPAKNNAQEKSAIGKVLDLNLDELKSQLIKTIHIGKFLYFLEAINISELDEKQKIAVQAKDERFQFCSEQEAQSLGMKKSDCIFVPSYYVSAQMVDISMVNIPNKELPEPKFTVSKNSQILKIDSNESLKEFKFAPTINFPDQEIIHLADTIDLESEYLYVPTTAQAPREIADARPFWKGDEKIVKLKKVEDGVLVYQAEQDKRFDTTDRNDSPVLTLTGSHVDFKCIEDEFGQCTKHDGFDTEKSYKERRFFIPNLNGLQVHELNSLDLFGLFDIGMGCFRLNKQKVVDSKFEEGVINITLERSYTVAKHIKCFLPLLLKSSLDDASFKMKFHYSLVRLKDIASKNYDMINYPKTEHSQFGFFLDERQVLDDIFDPNRKKISYKLNRFNPKKGIIHYHLTDNFNESENKYLKEATFKAVATINNGLKEAQTGLQIQLNEPSGKQPGDLRYNFIALITDPLANGLLGYGPSVTNPRTGEIVKAHTNMYAGVLKSGVRRSYNAMRDISILEAKNQLNDLMTAVKDKEDSTSTTSEAAPLKTSKSKKVDLNKTQQRIMQMVNNDELMSQIARVKFNFQDVLSKYQKLRQEQGVATELEKDLDLEDEYVDKKMKAYSENNAYHISMFNFDALAKTLFPGIKEIPNIKDKNGILIPFETLNKSQLDKVSKIVMVNTYTSTLIHELGHNLGLRHNFQGSFDKNNFFSEEEAKEKGLHNVPAYSSIMDYAYSELNELSTFGKYDLAALRFGYGRKVELTEKAGFGELGKAKGIVDIPAGVSLEEVEESLDDETVLKPYGFCTDGNVGTTSSCNRFDEGTTLVEIAEHMVENYKTYYKYTNLRDGRNTFNDRGITRYVLYQNRKMLNARNIFEDWEVFANIFNKDILTSGCSEGQLNNPDIRGLCLAINDRRDAVKIVSDHLFNILETPDQTCLIIKEEEVKKENSDEVEVKQVPILRKLKDIYADGLRFNLDYVPVSCFDQKVVEKLKEDKQTVVAQKGRYLNDVKDPTSNIKNDIAVRGIWSDKLLAMKYLTSRLSETSSTEDIKGSLLDLAYNKERMKNLTDHFVLGKPLGESAQIYTDASGNEIKVLESLAINLGEADYIVPEQPTMGVIRHFKLPFSDNVLINKVLLNQATRYGSSEDVEYGEEAQKFVDSLSVTKLAPTDVVKNKDLQTLEIGRFTYMASKENSTAFELIQAFSQLKMIKRVSKDEIKEILQKKSSFPDPNSLSEDENIVMTLIGYDSIPELIALFERIGEDNLPEPDSQPPHLAAALRLKVKGLNKLIQKVEEKRAVPEEAKKKVKDIWDFENTMLQSYLDGKLEDQVNSYRTTIKLLPEQD